MLLKKKGKSRKFTINEIISQTKEYERTVLPVLRPAVNKVTVIMNNNKGGMI